VALKVAVASLAIAALVVGIAAATELSLGRAALLAPVLVVGVGAVIGLTVFWGRVALLSLREARRPKLIVAAAVAFVGLLVGLTLLGVKLPHE
jgi:hypothetical protein